MTPSANDDLLDLLEMTAPVASGPMKTDPIDTDKLLHGIAVPDTSNYAVITTSLGCSYGSVGGFITGGVDCGLKRITAY